MAVVVSALTIVLPAPQVHLPDSAVGTTSTLTMVLSAPQVQC